jgi:cell division protein ZapD
MSSDGRETHPARFTDGATVAQNSAMSEEAQQTHEPAPAAAPLIFEQPLNERMRTFLRLDFLYSQALYHNEMQSQWGSRAAMGSLLDILAIAARGDVRAECRRSSSDTSRSSTCSRASPGRLGATAHRNVQSAAPAPTCACGSNYLARPQDQNSCRPSNIAAPSPAAPEAHLPDFLLAQPGDHARARSFNEWLATLRPL